MSAIFADSLKFEIAPVAVGRVSIPCGDLMIARAEMDASGIAGDISVV